MMNLENAKGKRFSRLFVSAGKKIFKTTVFVSAGRKIY
jgi:hypothetical protein